MGSKNIFKALIAIILLSTAGYYIWYVYFNFRLEEISKQKVYKSALIPPNKLDKFLLENKIKTVINLLDGSVLDKLNPASNLHINAQDKAIMDINKKYKTNIKHIHIPSRQVPTKKTLAKFFDVLDNKRNYPVLIHCYHGTGRAQIYSAVYRIEYENWDKEDARSKTRVIVEGLGYKSAFAKGRKKGDFLINYRPRVYGKDATINTLKK